MVNRLDLTHETLKVSKYYELSVTGNQILTFTFIKRKFIIVGSEVIELEGITSFTNNGSVLKNPEISGALYTLRIQY